MKLRTKIQGLFCGTILIILLLMAVFLIPMVRDSSDSLVGNNLSTSATLAANHISQEIQDYLNAMVLLGKEEVMYSSASTDSRKLQRMDEIVKQYGLTSGNVLNSRGISLRDGTNFSNRYYVKMALKGQPNVSEINLSKLTNTYGLSVAAPICQGNQVTGVVYARLDVNFMEKIINSVSVSENSYAYLMDKEGNILVHPNKDYVNRLNLAKKGEKTKALVDANAKGETGSRTYEWNGQTILCGYAPIEKIEGYHLVVAAPEKDFQAAVNRTERILAVVFLVGIVFIILVSAVVAGRISKPVGQVKDTLVALSSGDFQGSVYRSRGKDEVAILQNATVDLVDTVSGILGEAGYLLQKIAECDLTREDMKQYPGEFNSLSQSVNRIKATLNHLILQVQMAAQAVDTGSGELADGAQELSQGTVSQADSIQALTDNLGIVVEKIQKNSEREEEVNASLEKLDGQIQSATGQMEELRVIVHHIEEMSSGIQKIVATIDNIAFQTNILSLNASVEAARAGEYGNGFAVVAEEIRDLAEKCSESSKQTEELIHKTLSYIDNAKGNADATYESLTEVAIESGQVAQNFKKISEDTREQADKSRQVQAEIQIISDVIQNNTATVEETAAATEALSEQSMNLDSMVRRFQVKR